MTRIRPKPLIGFLLNPFGVHARSLELHNDELLVIARREQHIQIANLKTAPSITTGFWGSMLNVAIDNGTSVALRGVRHSDANSFKEAV
ncbi:MAG: hypothetical protein CSB47_04550 [Proteobacteria bacterium]|nr:MAG: hypothetical protein CSB47_04550 [Pseudomonadota bacterium]